MKTPVQFFLLFLLAADILSFKCDHDSAFKDFKPELIDLSNSPKKHKRNLASTFEPIEIELNFQGLKTNDAVYFSKLKTVFQNTIKIFESLLKVDNTKTITMSSPTKCNPSLIDVTAPLTTTKDLIIFPIINPNLPSGVMASATACFLDSDTYRPIAGFVYLGQSYDFSKTNAEYYLEMLLLHEITHILVFSENLFKYFPDAIKPVTETVTINGVSRTRLTTPKVVAAAKKHYNCNTLTGVELEDQGGEGSAGSHWESRIMLGDYMISTDYNEIAISDMSLALFEDSGWYEANYYTGGLFRFGKNMGCSFLEEKCITSTGGTTFSNDFCTIASAPGCLPGHTSKGKCGLYMYSSITIPTQYRYYSESNKGGYVAADYCPVNDVSVDSSYYYSQSCKFGKTTLPKGLEESVGDNSVCVVSSLVNQAVENNADIISYKGKERAICHEITCDSTTNTVNIKIGSATASCTQGTSKVTVSGYSGELTCPDYNRVCTSSTFCNDVIDCINKKTLTGDIVEGKNETDTNGVIINKPSFWIYCLFTSLLFI